MTTTLTFADLARLDPELRALELEVRRTPVDAGYCAIDAWYGTPASPGGYRARFIQLVGHFRRKPGDDLLRESLAYAVGTDHLFDLLPFCHPECDCNLPGSL